MTRDISKFDDTIDVRDVIERFEELEALRKPWAAGWNMPGFMPDSEPASFETCAEACDYIASEMRRAIDEDATCTEHWLAGKDAEDAAKNHDALEDAAKRWDSIADDEREHGETVGNYHYWVSKVSGPDAFEDEDEGQEYEALKSLLEDLKGNGGDEDWRGDWYPITLIRDSYFQDYAQELAEDCCPFPSHSAEGKALQMWPYRCIDWEQAARELRMDYSSVEFHGVTFWYR